MIFGGILNRDKTNFPSGKVIIKILYNGEFSITDETLAYMHDCREELLAEPSERLFGELSRALTARRPSQFFRHKPDCISSENPCGLHVLSL